MQIPFLRSASITSVADLAGFAEKSHAAIETHLAAFPASSRTSLHEQLDAKLAAAGLSAGDTVEISIEITSAAAAVNQPEKSAFNKEVFLREFEDYILARLRMFNELADSDAYKTYFPNLKAEVENLCDTAANIAANYADMRSDVSQFFGEFKNFNIPSSLYLKPNTKIVGDAKEDMTISGVITSTTKVIEHCSNLLTEYGEAIDALAPEKATLRELKQIADKVGDVIRLAKNQYVTLSFFESSLAKDASLPEEYTAIRNDLANVQKVANSLLYEVEKKMSGASSIKTDQTDTEAASDTTPESAADFSGYQDTGSDDDDQFVPPSKQLAQDVAEQTSEEEEIRKELPVNVINPKKRRDE